MPDTVLTAAIHTVISQPTVALMRNEMGIGAAVLSGTNTGDDGTVTSVAVASANGFTGSVANPTTTPSITIIPGNITPTAITCSGVISAGGGTEALPAFVAVTGSPDTGVFFPAPDQLGFSTAATEKARFIASGFLGLGTPTPLARLHVGDGTVNNSLDASILASREVDDTGAGNAHAFSDSSVITRTGVVGYTSYDAQNSFEGAAAYNYYTAFQSKPSFTDITTISEVYHFYSLPDVASGTITNHCGAFFSDPSGAGTITNNYGIFIADQTKGSTLNYAIWSEGGKNYFGGDVAVDKTVTPALTVGNQPISKNAGTVNFAAGATTLTVTNTRVTANSIIMCSIGTVDATFTNVKAVVAGSGSFVIHANAAATAETRVNFLVIN